MTSRSITGRDFPDFEKLDAVIASAVKKLLNTHSNFRKRASVEEQRAQNTTDSYDKDRLCTWSTSFSVQPELMKQYNDS